MVAIDSFDAVRHSLRPRVFGDATVALDQLELELNGQETGLEAVRVLAPGLQVGVVVDDGSSEVRVSEARCRDWGVSFDEVLPIAIGNAMARRPVVEPVANSVVLLRGPQFDPCLWLVDGLVGSLGVNGDLVMVTPVRGFTLVGRDDSATLTVFAGVIVDMLEAGQWLESVTACRLDAGRWVAVDWGSSGVAERLTRPLTRLFSDQLYGRQKPLLEALHSRQGDDVFVASYKVMQGQDGQVFSMASWGEGVATLLPVVDVVNLVKQDFSQRSVPWEQLISVTNGSVENCGLLPERFKAVVFPSGL